MPLYINELAPWEEKRNFLESQAYRRNMVHDVEKLNTALKAQLVQDIRNTKEIESGQQRISQGIDGLADNLGRIENGINSIGSVFEWGISEIVWQFEQNRNVLKQILAVLMAPLDTKAKERKNRADKAFANGWWDDAEEEYLASRELNKFDFSIHISLGMIYNFHSIDKHKARDCFKEAFKYAKADSKYYACYSALYLALVYRDLGEIDKAEAIVDEGISIYPKMPEAYYQSAIYNVLLENTDKAIAGLREAIILDKLYLVKILKDNSFRSISDEIELMVSRLTNEAKQKAMRLIIEKIERLQIVDNFLNDLNTLDIACCNKNLLYGAVENAKGLVENNNYLDCVKASDILFDVEKNTIKFFDELGSDLLRIGNYIQAEKATEEKHINEIKEKIKFKTKFGFISVGIVIFILTFVFDTPLILLYILIAPFVYFLIKKHLSSLDTKKDILSQKYDMITELQSQRMDIINSFKKQEKSENVSDLIKAKLGNNYLQEVKRIREEQGLSLAEAKEQLLREIHGSD